MHIYIEHFLHNLHSLKISHVLLSPPTIKRVIPFLREGDVASLSSRVTPYKKMYWSIYETPILKELERLYNQTHPMVSEFKHHSILRNSEKLFFVTGRQLEGLFYPRFRKVFENHRGIRVADILFTVDPITLNVNYNAKFTPLSFNGEYWNIFNGKNITYSGVVMNHWGLPFIFEDDTYQLLKYRVGVNFMENIFHLEVLHYPPDKSITFRLGAEERK